MINSLNMLLNHSTIKEQLLKFNYTFNQEIAENIIPEYITLVEFGELFNQAIKPNVLPKSLTHLIL